MVIRPGMIFQSLINITDDPDLDQTVYLCVANMEWAVLGWPLLAEDRDGSAQLDPNGSLQWHYVFDLDQHQASLAEPVLTADSKIALKPVEWNSPLRIMISAYSVDLCFEQLVFLAEHGLGIRSARSFKRIDLVKKLAEAASANDDSFVSAVLAEIDATQKRKQHVEEGDAEGDQFAQMLLEHMDNDEVQEYQKEMKIGMKEKNIKKKKWQAWHEEEVQSKEKKKKAKEARAKAKFAARKPGKGRGKGKKGKGGAPVRRRLSFASAAGDLHVPDDGAGAAHEAAEPEVLEVIETNQSNPAEEASHEKAASPEPERADLQDHLSSLHDHSDKASVDPEVSNDALFKLKAETADAEVPAQVAVASMIFDDVGDGVETLDGPSSSTAAPPPISEEDHGVGDVVAAGADDSSTGAPRPGGPRGPNLHHTPGSLMSLAPPGATITLNSCLSLGGLCWL